MKKKIVWIAPLMALMALALPTKAQKVFSMEEAVTWGNGKLYPTTLSGTGWVPGSSTFYYRAKDNSGEDCMVFRDADRGHIDTLFLDELNDALVRYNGMHRPTAPPIDSFKSMPGILNWQDDREMRIRHKKIVFLYDYTKNALMPEHGLSGEEDNLEFHAQSGHIAYTQGQNVFIKPYGKAPVQISFDSVDGILNGTAVHRNEFGIHKGLFWSEDGEKLAWYRMDESMVTRYPIYDIDGMPAKADFIRYPFAGATSHQVKLWVYDLKHDKKVEIQTEGPAEQYLTNIAFGPKGDFVYIAIVNRDQNHLWLNKYKTENGEFVQTMFEEKHDKYVEPESPMHWISKNEFIWESERDGYNHLYLYDKHGILKGQLSKGNWVVTEFLGADPKGKEVYFMSTVNSALDRSLCRVNIKSGEMTVLTKNAGYHRCEGNDSKRYWIDLYSAFNVPGMAEVLDSRTGKSILLKKTEDPLKEYELGEIRQFTLTSEDGKTPLQCRMILPTHFDSTKKYPVVVYVYGGPHLQLITNTYLYGSNLWMQYMAQHGYIVFSLDNRGSANRGLEFENAVFRQLGTAEIADQLKGVEWLKQQGYVDQNRMAVHGWSFGGFMTTSLMTRTPGTFRVGVAGGPVIDWAMYEVMYTERYMDRPEENPEGYKKANLLEHIPNLNGKLLLIHGTSDDVVLWQHTLLYLRECVKKEVLIDYFVYPEHPHNVRGKDRVHLMRKITEYLEENLED